MRIVHRSDLDSAMMEFESGADDRVPFTQDEADAMAADPCAFGYHRFTPTAEEMADPDFAEFYEGLTCLNGCGYGIG